MNIEKKNWKWLVAYGATLLLPWGLIFSRGAADACCVMIGVLFLWQSCASKKWDWLGEPFVRVSFLAWAWLVVVVSPLAISPSGSFAVALPWIRYILMFAALKYWVLEKEESLLLLAKMLAGMFVFVIIDTLFQYNFGASLTGNLQGDGGRLTGPLEGVKVGIFIAKLLLPVVIICSVSALRRGKYSWIIYGLLLLVGEVTIMLSGERTAFITSLLALFGAMFALALAEKYARIAAPFIVALVAAGSFILLKTQDSVLQRAIQFKDTIIAFGDSVYGKLFAVAYAIGVNHWFSGAGLKGYRIASLTMEDMAHPYCADGEFCNLHPHNPYLEWFSEAGLPGLLLFSAVVIILLMTALRCFRQVRGTSRLLAASALASVIINCFPLMVTQSIFSNWPGILLWYSLAVSFAGLNMCKNSTGADNLLAIDPPRKVTY